MKDSKQVKSSFEEELDSINELKKVNVFIDTNIYIQKKYDVYNDSDFSTLSQYIKEDKVSLYTHKIIVEEVKKHFRNEVYSNMERYRLFHNELKLLKGTSLSIFSEQLSDQDLINPGIMMINEYFNINKATILDYSGVSLESIFDDYFNNKFPFENKKGKKNEFPDAVIMASLNLNKPTNGFIIVTNDVAWKEIFRSDRETIVVNSLKDCLDHISKSEKLYDMIHTYYQSSTSKQRVEELIIESIDSNNLDVDGREYDRKGVVSGYEYDDVKVGTVSVSLGKLTIQKISLNKDSDQMVEVYLNYKVLIRCSIFGSYTDYENSIWDSEEKEYINPKTITVFEEHQTQDNISLLTKYDLAQDIHTSETVENGINISLDQYSLLKRIYYDNDFDDHYGENQLSSQITKDFVCQQCNNHFKIDFSKYVGNSETWNHGEDQMGYERYYEIEERIVECQFCGAQYFISGSYTEYPVGALNYDDTKIELISADKEDNE